MSQLRDFGTLAERLCKIDLSRAQATRESDRDSIFEAVKASLGFERVNTDVIGAMREWMVSCGRHALEHTGLPEASRPQSALHIALANLLRDHGQYVMKPRSWSRLRFCGL